MRRVWIATVMLAILMASVIYTTRQISSISSQLSGELDKCESALLDGNIENSAYYLSNAYTIWNKKIKFFACVSKHEELDAIAVNFDEARGAFLLKDDSLFMAKLYSLRSRIRQLDSSERVAVYNVF